MTPIYMNILKKKWSWILIVIIFFILVLYLVIDYRIITLSEAEKFSYDLPIEDEKEAIAFTLERFNIDRQNPPYKEYNNYRISARKIVSEEKLERIEKKIKEIEEKDQNNRLNLLMLEDYNLRKKEHESIGDYWQIRYAYPKDMIYSYQYFIHQNGSYVESNLLYLQQGLYVLGEYYKGQNNTPE
jgi:hypothetical protein